MSGSSRVTMPKWGLSMQPARSSAGSRPRATTVSVGDELADIETEKIAGTLEAADAGTLRRIIARVGEDVPVSGTIALIAPAGVSDADIDAFVARGARGDRRRRARRGRRRARRRDGRGRRAADQLRRGRADGDVVLLVHGYGGDRNSWLFLQEPLAARHRVYALDLPGHGTSAKDVGDGSVEPLADAVLGVLDAIGVRARPPGRSLAGRRRRARGRGPGPAPRRLAHPDRARPASARRSTPATCAASPTRRRGASSSRSSASCSPTRAWSPASWSTTCSPTSGSTGSRRRCTPWWARSWTATRSAPAPPRPSRRSAGRCRSRWSGARADRIIPPAQAEAVAGAARHLLDGAGHMPHMERPAEVQAAIEESIARAG